jgi:hypothetical protein
MNTKPATPVAGPAAIRREAREATAPDQFISSRLTTDGTRYLLETYESTDGTRELPHPMIDPQGHRGRLPDDWPIGDPRRG